MFTRCLLLAVRVWDDWDESKHPRKSNGQFGKGGSTKATGGKKKYYRQELIGYRTSCGAFITGVSDHACDRMTERGLSPDDVKAALKLANPKKSIRYPGTYDYAINGRFVTVAKNATIVSLRWQTGIPWKRGK